MISRGGLAIIRQAGSAAGLMPALQELLAGFHWTTLVIIAFPQAVATCREVVLDLGRFSFHAIQTETDAREIFDREIDSAVFLLTGTSFAAVEDAYYWRGARAKGVTSMAYLDQWSNVEKRFPGHDRNDWPDILAVIDENDKQLAEAIAPAGVLVRNTGSPAIERVKRAVQELRADGLLTDENRVVFATEPVEDRIEYRKVNGFLDEDCFAVACQLIRKYHSGCLLVIRLHPRDSRERWASLLPGDIAIEWDTDTREACLARAGMVLGMRSFFLLEAWSCSVKVISIQPRRKTSCPLTDGRMPVITDAAEYRP